MQRKLDFLLANTQAARTEGKLPCGRSNHKLLINRWDIPSTMISMLGEICTNAGWTYLCYICLSRIGAPEIMSTSTTEVAGLFNLWCQ